MVINLPQVVRSIILIDPGYILAGIIQSFPVGTQPQERVTSTPDSKSSFAEEQRNPSGSLEKDLLSIQGHAWKLPLLSSTRHPQQIGGTTTQNDHRLPSDPGQKDDPRSGISDTTRETPLPNPDDPITFKGMMEMMWLGGSDLLG